MINKIKDKQTGEYHDIGGLKCKLVAEGELLYTDSDYFQMPYQFENGKYYAIHIFYEGFSRVVFIGIFLENEFLSSVSKENMVDNFVGITITNNELYFWNYTSDSLNELFIENHSYKIYELPFALEV